MENILTLPNGRFIFSQPLPEKHLLMVAGGRRPAKNWLIETSFRFPVWCIDKGIDCCKEWGIIPERIIGDGDSADLNSWRWGQTLGVPVEIHPSEKKLTDLQLALQRAVDIYSECVLVATGVWGGRFDHIFSNVYSLIGSEKFGIKRCCAADEDEVLVILKGKDVLQIEPGKVPEVISLLPFSSSCTGVSISGVHWPLDQVELKQCLPYAISNRPGNTASSVLVSVEEGCLGVYLSWKQ